MQQELSFVVSIKTPENQKFANWWCVMKFSRLKVSLVWGGT